jgi:glutamate synthase domain-containing protein 3
VKFAKVQLLKSKKEKRMEVISAETVSTREINTAIRNATNHNGEETVYVRNASGLNNIAVGIKERASITVGSDVGDLIGALNDGATIRIEGNAGKYAGDGMTAGEVIIKGDADDGAGTAMCGGTLVIKGNARSHVGQLMKGGTVIVGGNVGNHVGSFMIAGTIVIGGDAGRELGGSMIGGKIYIKGRHEAIGPGLQETELNEDEKRLLRELFAKYELRLDVDRFKKIVPQPKKLI